MPVAYADKDGVIKFTNDRFVKTFGYTHADVPTVTAWLERAYPDPEYRRQVTATWGAAVKRAASDANDIEPIAYQVTCKNGQVRTVEISGTTLEDELLVTFVDQTERKRVADEVRAMMSDTISKESTQAAGVCEILSKPYSTAALAGVVCQYLSSKSRITTSRILLIEDDQALRRAMSIAFSKSGYDVIETGNGVVGLAAFKLHHVDLVVTDIIMPEMEGIETIRKLRTLNSEIPIIAITGGGRTLPDNYLHIAELCGATRVFANPFELSVLCAAVAKLFAKD